jgi:hypothetical protein
MEAEGTMNAQVKIPASTAALAAFCRKWRIAKLALFGSVLRNDFRPGSDVDVLVTFAGDARPGLLDRLQMVRELEELFHRRVDLVERSAVEESPNYVRRREILESAEVIAPRTKDQ